MSGGCRERVTPAGSLRQRLEPTTTKGFSRVVIVGYNKGTAQFVHPTLQRLRASTALDFINEVFVDVTLGKTTVHLEPCTEVLVPIIIAQAVREKYYTLAR